MFSFEVLKMNNSIQILGEVEGVVVPFFLALGQEEGIETDFLEFGKFLGAAGPGAGKAFEDLLRLEGLEEALEEDLEDAETVKNRLDHAFDRR